jgi:hypothetical protein
LIKNIKTGIRSKFEKLESDIMELDEIENEDLKDEIDS